MAVTSNTKPKARVGGGILAAGIFALIGAIFCTVGLVFVTSQNGFAARSEVADLLVLEVERKQSDEGYVYRPTFQATDSAGTTLSYTSRTWVSPQPHTQGEVASGRVDWASGEIRSTAMMTMGRRLGIIFAVLGVILMGISVVAMMATARRRRRARQSLYR